MTHQTSDRHGVPVQVGTKVRVLIVRDSVLARLSKAEARRVQSMQGEIFEVYEVDAWGSTWVQKWWQSGRGKSESHSLGLVADEMEAV